MDQKRHNNNNHRSVDMNAESTQIAIDHDQQYILDCQDLYRTVFCQNVGPENSEQHEQALSYLDDKRWKERTQQGLLLAGLERVDSKSCNDDIAMTIKRLSNVTREKVVAFCLSYPRQRKMTFRNDSDLRQIFKSTLHIWLVGVDPDYRRCGIWSRLLRRTLEFAKQSNHAYLTISTIPKRFPNMYLSLKKYGFLTVVDAKEGETTLPNIPTAEMDHKILLYLPVNTDSEEAAVF